jgi:hypothetical protein
MAAGDLTLPVTVTDEPEHGVVLVTHDTATLQPLTVAPSVDVGDLLARVAVAGRPTSVPPRTRAAVAPRTRGAGAPGHGAAVKPRVYFPPV